MQIRQEKGCYTPVSYTHLDVYKRQVWGVLYWLLGKVG